MNPKYDMACHDAFLRLISVHSPMKTPLFFLLFTVLLSLHADAQALSAPAPETYLLLVGGGARPISAMAEFSRWTAASAKHAQHSTNSVLIIGWSSAIPADYFATISADLRPHGINRFFASLIGPKTSEEVRAFLHTLQNADAVFFTGGNQNKAMEIISNPLIRQALENKFYSGTPFAGTSAGTAIMAHTMLTGDESKTGIGLGFFKKGIIDMHFIIRNREARLKQAMLDSHIDFGIGIDEGAALAITNMNIAEVMGPKDVMYYHTVNHVIQSTRLSNGEKFKLDAWKLMNCQSLIQ